MLPVLNIFAYCRKTTEKKGARYVCNMLNNQNLT